MSVLQNLRDIWITAGIGGLIGIIFLIGQKFQTFTAVLSFVQAIWHWIRNRLHPKPPTHERATKKSVQLNQGGHAQVSNSNIGNAGRDFVGRDVHYHQHRGLTTRQFGALIRRFERPKKVQTPRPGKTRSKPSRRATELSESQTHSSNSDLDSRSSETSVEEQVQDQDLIVHLGGTSLSSNVNNSIEPPQDNSRTASETLEPNNEQQESQIQPSAEPLNVGADAADDGIQAAGMPTTVEESAISEPSNAQTTEGEAVSVSALLLDELELRQQDVDTWPGGQQAHGSIPLHDSGDGDIASSELGSEADHPLVLTTVDRRTIQSDADAPSDTSADVSKAEEGIEFETSETDEEVSANDIKSSDESTRQATEESTGYLDAEIQGTPTDSQLATVDNERTTEISAGNTDVSDMVATEVSDGEGELHTQVISTQHHSESDDEAILRQLLEDYPLNDVGASLKKRRISVGIRQADINFDRGWVQAIEDGVWNSSRFASGRLPLQRLQHYLYVVGWSTEDLKDSLLTH